MTALTLWLTRHHIPYGVIGGTTHHKHLIFTAFSAHCQHAGELTAWAVYGAHVVAYCYPK